MAGRRKGGERGKGTVTIRAEFKPPLRDLARNLDKMSRKELKDFRPIWDRITPVVAAEVGRIISSQGASIDAPWKPHSAEYGARKRKRKRVKGKGLLHLTGKLKKRIKTTTKTKSLMKYGVKGIPYARAMLFGRKRRAFLAITEKMQKVFQREADWFVDQMLRKHGFR